MKGPQVFTKQEQANIAAFIEGNPMALQMLRSLDPMSMRNFLYGELPFLISQRQNQVISKAQKKIGLGVVGSLVSSTFISVLSTPYIIKMSKWIRYPLRTLFFVGPLALTSYYVLAPAYDDLMKTHMNISRRIMRLAKTGRVQDFYV